MSNCIDSGVQILVVRRKSKPYHAYIGESFTKKQIYTKLRFKELLHDIFEVVFINLSIGRHDYA